MIAGTLEIQMLANLARLQKDMDDAKRSVGGAMSHIEETVGRAKAALGGLVGFLSAKKILEYADAWGQLSSRMAISTGSIEKGNEALKRLMELSNRVYKPIEATSEMFIRTSKTLYEMGYASEASMKMVEALSYSLTVSGADAMKSESVMEAWSKSILKGKMEMKEFTTIIAGAPRLQAALADALGVTNAGLMEMVRAGDLTVDKMMQVGEQAIKLGKETDQMPVSLSDAFTKIQNSLKQFFGQVDDGAGVIKLLTSGMGLLADNLGLVVGVLGTMAAVKFAVWLETAATKTFLAAAASRAKTLAALDAAKADVAATGAAAAVASARVAELRAAVAAAEGNVALAITTNGLIPAQARATALAEAHAAALRTQDAAAKAASVSAGIASGALGVMGGPIGWITLLLGLGATAWAVWGGKAKEASDLAAKSVTERHAEIMKALKEQEIQYNQLNAAKKAGMTLDEAKKNLPAVTQLMDQAKELADLNAGVGRFAQMNSTEKMLERARITREIVELNNQIAATSAAGAAAEQRGIAEVVAELKVKYATKKEQMEAELASIAYLKGQTDDYEMLAQRIRDKYKDSSSSGLANSALKLDVENAKRAMEERVAAYADAEKIMEATRAAGKMSEADYYESSLAFIRLKADAQIAGLAAENARMEAETAAGKRSIDIQNKIAENESKMAIVRAQATAQAEALGTQRVGVLDKERIAFEQAEAAAQAYLDTARRGYARDLGAFGMGDDQRNRASGRSQIEDRYAQQLLDLERDKRNGLYQFKDDQYKQDLERIQRFRTAALAEWETYYDRRKELEGQWQLGMSEALANYRNDSRNTFRQTADLFTNAMRGMEDAMVNFAMTGKLSFSDLARSVIADIIRMQSKAATSGLFDWLGKAVGPLFGSTSADVVSAMRLDGLLTSAKGNVFESAGLSAYSNQIVTKPTIFPFARGAGLMGEAGPEAILPLTRTAGGALGVRAVDGGKGGDMPITVIVNAETGATKTQGAGDMAKLGSLIGNKVREVIMEEQRNGGLLAV